MGQRARQHLVEPMRTSWTDANAQKKIKQGKDVSTNQKSKAIAPMLLTI